MVHENILKSIGRTPMVKLNSISGNQKVRIYAKMEGQNPGGSIKDRAALYMIEKAEERGNLKKGMSILEATSGNMGISLAMIGAQKGYDVNIVMSEGMSDERKAMLKALGANLILTDKNYGTEGAIKKAKELFKNSPEKFWFSDQFNNPDNTDAHYHGIAGEIINELETIDYLVVGVGTSGTLMGIYRRFKEDSPETKIIAVYPPGGYKIQGLQNPEEDFSGSIYDRTCADESRHISKEEAYGMSREAAQKEGLFIGMSSGAALFAAKKIAAYLKSGNIVAIIPDRGEKYLSTELYA